MKDLDDVMEEIRARLHDGGDADYDECFCATHEREDCDDCEYEAVFRFAEWVLDHPDWSRRQVDEWKAGE